MSPTVRVLLSAIEACKREWAGEKTYNDVAFNLDKAAQELELLFASPGRRAAASAAAPLPSGQEPTDRSEAPSEVY